MPNLTVSMKFLSYRQEGQQDEVFWMQNSDCFRDDQVSIYSESIWLEVDPVLTTTCRDDLAELVHSIDFMLLFSNVLRSDYELRANHVCTNMFEVPLVQSK